ncbi:hypothetical protein J6590_098550 [Homalodisca vitripennis]|nr:hypothetical protein J6590_098550 [Homalodisca vitripennis]
MGRECDSEEFPYYPPAYVGDVMERPAIARRREPKSAIYRYINPLTLKAVIIILLLSVVGCEIFPFQEPTIVAHHGRIPAALISAFNCSDVLVEPLALFVTYGSQIFRKKSK